MSDTPHPAEGAAGRGAMRVAPLHASDRARVEQILRATVVFRDEEVEVALELFDLVFGGKGSVDGGADAPEPDYTFVGVFTDAGLLVGYACYGPTPATDRTYDLYWIAVDPAAQGTGAGTRLLAEVERRLCNARGRMLVVETSSRDEYDATRGFYAARGYEEAARVGHFYAPGDDRVIYTKRLSAAGSRVPASGTTESAAPRAESVVPGPGFGLGTNSLTSTTSPDGRGAAAQ